MTVVNHSSALAGMLTNAFSKLDQDRDGKLDASEFQSFYEILRAGIAVDDKGNPTVSAQDYRSRMDADSDGCVTVSEMQDTGVLMPANLTSDSLDSMIQYLLGQASESALTAASLLAQDDLPVEPQDQAA